MNAKECQDQASSWDTGWMQTVKRQLTGPGREEDSTLWQDSGKGQNGDTDRGPERVLTDTKIKLLF